MSVRLVISMILLCCIVLSGVLLAKSIDNLCSDIIESAKTTAERYDVGLLNDIKYEWDKISNYLTAFIPHEYVDTVTESLERSIAFLNHNTKDEFDAEITRFINLIEVIRQYDVPSVRSIF